jgi:8-oxo-dGTP pyrophosphatase MutT (NUDIX family)
MLGGSFILMFNKDRNSVLLGRRSPKAEWNPNTWCPFGGTIENTEHPLDTAYREYQEETQISSNLYKISSMPIFVKKTLDSNRQMHRMFLYLGILHCEIYPVINDEHSDYVWCPIEELPTYDTHPIISDLFLDDASVNIMKNLLSR